ncbi:MAG: cadherin-like beta sandwich domain-containing protein [Mollicutes bacterium]|nr:cadherin-like beta sandwich domain-containing protein [Mollicutes bacterium]
MKIIKYLFYSLFTFFFLIPPVYAAGTVTLSVNSGTIENGSKVTATVTAKNVAAWNVTISSSGATSGCTEKFVGDSGTGKNTTKSFSVTCKATSVGIINFSISGDITSENGNNTKISGSKSVKVVTPREKSNNNKLKSLSVSDYTISPEFNASTNEYYLTVPSTTEKITISATKADSYATLEGTGEKEVNLGTNVFEIVVTSETGISNIYKLTVSVEDLNPIEVEINGEKYTVVKEDKNLKKPELFDETTVKINNFDIPAFYNEQVNYTLVGLKNSEGIITLYIYDNGKYQMYHEYTSDKLTVVFLTMDKNIKFFNKTKLTINEEEVIVYKYKSFNIVYGVNLVNGEKHYYNYDAIDNTLQKIDLDQIIDDYNQIKDHQYIIYALGSAIVILILIIILLSRNKAKIKKIETKLEAKKEKKKK